MSGGVQPPVNPDPLRETSRYTKVADLSHGSFGFVQLARNTETQELVAIKFIERGDRVNRCALAAQHTHQQPVHSHVCLLPWTVRCHVCLLASARICFELQQVQCASVAGNVARMQTGVTYARCIWQGINYQLLLSRCAWIVPS